MSTAKFPCALLLNDIHISKDNISEFNKNWDEALCVCQQYKIPELVVGGDMWQSRSAQTLSTIMAVRGAILRAHNLAINLVLANGNHDKVDLEDYAGYNHIFSEYPGVTVVDDYQPLTWAQYNLSLWVMSYFPENGSFTSVCDKVLGALNNIAPDLNPQHQHILYLHEGIRGGLATPSDDELPAQIFNDFDKVLVGHYHNRKKVPNTNIEYIGSSRQHNFGEDEEKGYTILYSDGTTQFIKNEVNFRYKVIDVDLTNLDEAFMTRLVEIKADSRYKVKVRVQCTAANASNVDKQVLAEAGANKIELVTEQTEILHTGHQSITQKFDKVGIKAEYITFCTQKSIDTQLGIHYLDKLN